MNTAEMEPLTQNESLEAAPEFLLVQGAKCEVLERDYGFAPDFGSADFLVLHPESGDILHVDLDWGTNAPLVMGKGWKRKEASLRAAAKRQSKEAGGTVK